MFGTGSPASNPFGRQSSYSSQAAPPASSYQNQPNHSSYGGGPQFGLGSSSSSGWQGGSGSQSFGQGGQQTQFNQSTQPGSPFGQQHQQQFGQGNHFGHSGSTQPTSPSSQNQNQNFGDSQKRAYLPGYLSSRTQLQSESTPPPKNDESRSWDSPARRTSISSPSGGSRFGGASLFGNQNNSSLSRSPTGYQPTPPRQSAYQVEMEEDAPPVSSLGDYDQQSTSHLTSSHSDPPSRSPFSSASPLPSHSSHPTATSTPSPAGFAVHVFGFPIEATDAVVAHFSAIGDVVSVTPSPAGGNWVTIAFAQPWAAARAARKNGTILGGALMVGVKIVDEEQLRRAMGAEGAELLPEVIGGPGLNGVGAANGGGGGAAAAKAASSGPSGVGPPVQVVGASSAFKAAPATPRRGFFGATAPGAGAGTPSSDPHASLFAQKSQQAVLAQNAQAPKGVLGKVSDMVFGW